MRHHAPSDTTAELPAITESTKVKLKASTVFTVGAAVCSLISIIIGFTVWLNTMHNDVAQLKLDSAQLRNDVHELRVWLMPDHLPNENHHDGRISKVPPASE